MKQTMSASRFQHVRFSYVVDIDKMEDETTQNCVNAAKHEINKKSSGHGKRLA